MNDMKYILFSSPFCVACKPVKEFLSKIDIHGEYVDASEEQGSEIAVKFSVMKLPTVILLKGDEEVGRCHSVNEIKEILG